MSDTKESFSPNANLHHAIALLDDTVFSPTPLPMGLPTLGIGEKGTLDLLAPHVLGKAAHLDDSLALAHMDPPTPWITWAMALWNARLNQNLLHPATAPFAKEAEERVINWLTPFFGMQGGHFCSGSTLANLTALWAARDIANVTKVVASEAAHISIAKAAHILGLSYESIPTDAHGVLYPKQLGDLSHTCLVLTAGTTTLGAIDPLHLIGTAAWTHVDAAWAGTLRLSPKYAFLLENIEQADSIALSAHKWFFQPKDSALIFFKELHKANEALAFGGGYLATPNIGVQGSRGAAAIPLLATLLAWGKEGLIKCIEQTMQIAQSLALGIANEPRLEVLASGTTGINVFRPKHMETQTLYDRLPQGMFSTCTINGTLWIRSVSANPLANAEAILETLRKHL